jgi:hypothetical protein
MGRSLCARHDIALENGSTAPPILKFGPSFRMRPLYLWEKRPRYPLNKRLDIP